VTPVIVPVYAAVLALLFVALSLRVIRCRRRDQIAVGHGDSAELLRAARVQGNFAEYAPLALLLLAWVETRGFPGYVVHGLCLILVAGRVAHAFGMSQSPEDFRFRVGGMIAIFSVLSGAALLLLGAAIYPG
jgi:uncharacterized membrane protein YecN with MAPEG domain